MERDVLHTPRLELSAPRDRDAASIHAACQDAELQRLTTVPSPYLPGDAEKFIALSDRWWDEGSEATWAIRLDDRLVGMIGLARLGGGAPEIGYWMAREARGQGVVGEAAEAVVDWAFAAERPAIARIEWRAVVGNVASARTARRLGFRYEGLLRQAASNSFGRADLWVAGLLRDDERSPQPWPLPLG
ncbi:GNAT family N-acetyltransferase [Microbacterium sp. LMI1-1-1.1]|uniref:GNAT family N-acetyltransferase n=1 Tax=Microbacterium sp. LMI1-1-1.1 TaxID=3135223 RepID=UPI003464FB01